MANRRMYGYGDAVEVEIQTATSSFIASAMVIRECTLDDYGPGYVACVLDGDKSSRTYYGKIVEEG